MARGEPITCPWCGGEFVPGEKRRSSPHHRRSFRMLRLIYENWPHDHPQQFKSPKAMRKWLIAKAGYNETITIHAPPTILSKDTKTRLAAEVWMRDTIRRFRSLHEYSWIEHVDGGIRIYVPKSMSFNEMTQAEFGDLISEIKNVVWRETGLDPEALMEGRAA